jgi:imidazolonepropionase-like amidohydrolase
MITTLIALALLSQDSTVVIQDVSVVHPGDSKAVEHQTVVIRDDKILSVTRASSAPVVPDAKVVDGKGKFLMPGLWDMHVHLLDSKSLGLFTANGVTGIRTMFGASSHTSWRNQTDAGTIVGPRMVVGSPIVDGPKPVWFGSVAVTTPDQAREGVRKIKADGYDFVKVYSLLSREAYFAIADECKKVGIPFEGHVPHSIGILEAEKAGQRSSEHVMGLAVASSTKENEVLAQFNAVVGEGLAKTSEVSKKLSPEILATFDAKKWEVLLEKMSQGKMWQCPTLVVLKAVSYLDVPEFRKDERLKYVPAFLAAQWDPKSDFRLKNRTPAEWENAKKNFKQNLKQVELMHKAKVPIIAGTDCLNPFVFAGFSLHDELAMLVEAGMTPAEALATATVNPAKYYGLTKWAGDVKPGKRADLVLLSANPLVDIRNTTKIEAVVQRGRVFDRKQLDALLKTCEYGPASIKQVARIPVCAHN